MNNTSNILDPSFPVSIVFFLCVQAQAERMKAQAQGKIVKKLTLTHRRVEQKQAIAEAKRKRQAARTARQAEKIRRTGHISMLHFQCCSWFF